MGGGVLPEEGESETDADRLAIRQDEVRYLISLATHVVLCYETTRPEAAMGQVSIFPKSPLGYLSRIDQGGQALPDQRALSPPKVLAWRCRIYYPVSDLARSFH